MKVLLIHQVFAIPRTPGGTRHYELARHCVQAGHSFTIVASDISYNTGNRIVEKTKLVSEENEEGIQILRAYTLPIIHRSFFWRVVAFLGFMITSLMVALGVGDIDLVIGTSPPIFQTVSAWLVSTIRRKPFLLEIRDLWPEFAIDMKILKNPLLIAMSRKLELFLYNRSTHILVNSPAYKDYLLEKNVPEDKITLIPNGVDPRLFDPQSKGELVRDTYNLNGKFVVTYAGALGIANDISVILDAARQLSETDDIHILLVGGGKERANLEVMANEYELSNVTFAGPHPKSMMPDFLAASDACVATLLPIPMFQTTYPNKIFDYMAAGRPTILAIDGVIRQVIEAANGGIFVPPGDSTSLAAAIRKLANDRDLGHAMGDSAREYVKMYFDRRNQASDFLDLIVDLSAN